MKLLVLGASGLVGQELVKQAHARGHQVTALVRATTTYSAPEGVRVERGELLDPSVLQRALAGQEAVASAVGLRRKSNFPWSPLTSPPDLTSRSAELLVAALRASGVTRLCVVSAAGVADSAPAMNGLMKLLVSSSNIGVAYRDLARMERVLAGSGLEWQAVRPTTLSNAPATGRARLTERYGLTSSIPRADVAAFMLDRLERGDLTPRTPMITVSG